MHVGKFQFEPQLVPTVATLLVFPVLIALGFWQLERAEEKRRLIERFQSRLADHPVRLDGTQRDGEALAIRRVVLTGRYRSDRQVLLDNQIYRGRAGYHVLTPFEIAGTETQVLVNRGWVPLGRTRTMLPDIQVTEAELSITGQVHIPTGPPVHLGNSGDTAPGWPKVVQRIDIPALAQRLDTALLPYTIRLAKDQEHGYVRAWKAYYGAGPGKHQAYAVQWFGLAVILVIVYFALSTHRSGSSREMGAP